jgi:hypothetical protein
MRKSLLGGAIVASALSVMGSAYAFSGQYLISPATGSGTLQNGRLVYLRPDCTDGPTVDMSLFVTHNWNPNGQGGTYFNHALAQIPYPCAVAAEDGAPIVAGVQVNAFWMSDTANVAWRHTATATNIRSNYTYLDSPVLNGHPNAVVQVTPRGTGNPHNVGVWYDASAGALNPLLRPVGKWAVYNQDMAAMPANAQFNVYVGSTAGGNSDSFVVTCDATNRVRNWCYVPQWLGGSSLGPNMHLMVTSVWNPPGKAGVYNNHAIGVWWDASVQKWAVYNEDLAAMPLGASFNVSYAPGELTPG